jgi:hypothetical protein
LGGIAIASLGIFVLQAAGSGDHGQNPVIEKEVGEFKACARK